MANAKRQTEVHQPHKGELRKQQQEQALHLPFQPYMSRVSLEQGSKRRDLFWQGVVRSGKIWRMRTGALKSKQEVSAFNIHWKPRYVSRGAVRQQ